MSAAALLIVLAAAGSHAGWNLLAKRAKTTAGDGIGFVWLRTCGEVLLYAPVAAVVVVLTAPSFGATDAAFIGGSAVLHAAYVVLLQRGYTSGDLSLVYPIARGVGPLLAITGAVLFLGERPAMLALAGGLAVSTGVFWLASASRASTSAVGTHHGRALGYALATGLAIASYTLWDGHAMTSLTISPILYHWAANVGRLISLTPPVLGRWSDVRAAWRDSRPETVGIAALSPLAYILILWAFTLAPVAYVAPARELSIVIGTAFGARLLGEGRSAQRIPAAATVVVGVALLGLA